MQNTWAFPLYLNMCLDFPSTKMIRLDHIAIYAFKKTNTNLHSATFLILKNSHHVFTRQAGIVLNWNKSSAGKAPLLTWQ